MKKIIPVITIVLAVSFAIFLIAKPKQKQIKSNHSILSTGTQNRIIIGGKSLDKLRNSQTEDKQIYKARMNETLASKISLRQISYIKRAGNQDILVFNDGSELYVTNHIKQQLSDEILYRLELSSGKSLGKNHGY